ncbi:MULTISPECIES: GTP 3',8-cyclase MoaA [unclassified Arthrobacter]|uniref:GTP 3',8-cyclase MoaA n=1 Tax=unclassified Arthrobacter TaxID=235627 RepID=UPI001F016641|nr:GTP 3',8-cyclase MoaA [Arthrobacter sp. FW305-BF8]UKA55880.1 GTP 3',8-cyclase MoaA [Arthrobacter sp. FW305-BF8]
MSVQLGIPQLREGGAPDSGSQPLPAARPAGVPDRRPADAPAGLADRYGRRATDMRLSLTDKCNLRCTYCMPAEGLEWLSKQAVMTGEEIVRIVGIGVNLLGVRELRLTGGEPLVRADLVGIIGALRQAHPELPISMTTNGVGLDRKAAALKAAGLTRINVSLDSLHEETFTKLTRRPFLDRVLAGVDAAWAAGLGPVKLNAVLMRGINDTESPSLLGWALERGYELRFIEQMPLDADHGWTRRNMITAAEIRELLSEEFVLSPDPRARDGAPAERFEVRRRTAGSGAPGSSADSHAPVLGTVGIIASVTEPFCSDCRRTRITAEGKIMSCLFSREEFDLLGLLRQGASDEQLAERWQDAMWLKPKAHGMDHVGLDAPDFVQPDRSMSAIGG